MIVPMQYATRRRLPTGYYVTLYLISTPLILAQPSHVNSPGHLLAPIILLLIRLPASFSLRRECFVRATIAFHTFVSNRLLFMCITVSSDGKNLQAVSQ